MKAFLASLLLACAAVAPVQAATTNATTSSSVPLAVPSAAAPIWAKLVLAGNIVTCYYGTGLTAPTTWIQLGTPQTINFTNTGLLIGVYLTAHNTTAISNGTIDNFSITPASSYRLADCDIGAPSLMGSANLVNGVWNLSSSGSDIWGTSDQFNFQPWLVWSDCTVVCRITSLGSTAASSWQKIGIMIRDSYNSGSAYGSFVASFQQGVCFQSRTTSNANSDQSMIVAPAIPGVTSTPSTGFALGSPSAYVVRP